jgi:hypothetical protein
LELPELMVADAAAWRTWLNGNQAKSQGVRLVLAKKGTTHPTTLSYDEALDEAICFGSTGSSGAVTAQRSCDDSRPETPGAPGLNATLPSPSG